MANREANFVNNWSTVLDQEMAPTDLSAVVPATSSGPPSPCYLDIDYTDDDKREYIYFDGEFTGTAFVTTSIGNRYLEGSAAASGITHSVGAVVRASSPAQAWRDMHDRISANRTDLDDLEGHNHDAAYSAVGHSHAASAAVGDVLAIVAYDPGSLVSTAATASAVALDGTNLKATFTAPASGNVLVELSAKVLAYFDGTSDMYWSVYDAATGGSEVDEKFMLRQQSLGDSFPSYRAAPAVARMVVTGLTGGNEYTYFWRQRCETTNSPTSNPSTLYGGDHPAAVMKVVQL